MSAVYEIVLASASPRRREILQGLGIEFRVAVSGADEDIPEGTPPYLAVERLSLLKAADVAKNEKKNALVLGADTVVVLDGEILGKPKDEEDAVRMLTALSGREHSVLTGISVIRRSDAKGVSVYEETKVKFLELSDEQIRAYVKSGEPMDKAGAYGIQGKGSLLIEKIDGDYFNVVGLPVCRLARLLAEEFDYEIMMEVF